MVIIRLLKFFPKFVRLKPRLVTLIILHIFNTLLVAAIKPAIEIDFHKN